MAETQRPEGEVVDESITLKVIHHFPDDLPLTFSDNIAVQHTPTEFTITFAQIRQPIVAKASEYEAMENIRADVVARIVVTPTKMVELMKALQENWVMYQRRVKAFLEAKNVGSTQAETTNSPASKD